MGDDMDAEVRSLYQRILAGWNAADADAFAEPFADDGEVIGFDGSGITGRARISQQMASIFADHATGSYVGIIRDVRGLGADVALLRAVSGVIPAGQRNLNPALNAVQSLVASRGADGWRIRLYQNTPAQFHGQPHAAKALTEELRRHAPALFT